MKPIPFVLVTVVEKKKRSEMDGVFMDDAPQTTDQKIGDGIRLKKGPRDSQRNRHPDIKKLKSKSVVVVDGKDQDYIKRKRLSKVLDQSLPTDASVEVLLSASEDDTRISPTLSHGFVSVCGRRRTMEDTVTVAPGLLCSKQDAILDFYAVYDGHGGASVANVCRDKLHRMLITMIEEDLEEGENEECETDWNKVLEDCFVKMDDEVDDKGIEKSIGSTALVALIAVNKIIVANCGDSRAVLSRGVVVVPLSHDHKPDRPDELERVEAAGGRVINWNGYRVLGVLATSRSIGDQYLKPYVIATPEVSITERTEKDEFIILASDGLWDVMPNELACQVVRKCLSGRFGRRLPSSLKGTAAAEAAAVLAELAMAKGSKDNISVVVIELNKSS